MTDRISRGAFVAFAFLTAWLVPMAAHAETPIVEPAGQELAENLGGRPTWIAILITITWGLTRLIKDPSVPINIPPRWRPALALGLAMLVGGLEAIARAGLTWPAFAEGLQSGFIAGSGAIVVQELVVRWMLGGKTEPGSPPAVPPSASGLLAFVLVLALGSTACGPSAIVRGTDVANAAAKTINSTEPILTKRCTEGMKAVKTEADFAQLDAFCMPAFSSWEALRLAHVGLQAALTVAASGDMSKLPGAIVAVTTASVKLVTQIGGAK